MAIDILELITYEDFEEYVGDAELLDETETKKYIKDSSIRILQDANKGDLKSDWEDATITSDAKYHIQIAALILTNFYIDNGLNPQEASNSLGFGSTSFNSSNSNYQLPQEYYGALLKSEYYENIVYNTKEGTTEGGELGLADIKNDTGRYPHFLNAKEVVNKIDDETIDANKKSDNAVITANASKQESEEALEDIKKLKGSNIENDSTVAGGTVKEALETLDNKVIPIPIPWNYDAQGNRIINLGTPLNKTDATTKNYVDLEIDPLTKKTVLFGIDGYLLNTIYNPVSFPQAPLTQKMFNDNLPILPDLPVYKNQNFQNMVSRTTPARDDNYERTIKGWQTNPISTKRMFDIQTNGGLVINEDYRQEIAASGVDRIIRADLTADGFINSDGDYYAKFDVSGAFNFNNNRYLMYSNSKTPTDGYNGRNIHQTGTTFFTIPHGISAGDLLFVIIKVLRTPTGDLVNPYHLTFTEMGNDSIQGPKGEPGPAGDKPILLYEETTFNNIPMSGGEKTYNLIDDTLDLTKLDSFLIDIAVGLDSTNIIVPMGKIINGVNNQIYLREYYDYWRYIILLILEINSANNQFILTNEGTEIDLDIKIKKIWGFKNT